MYPNGEIGDTGVTNPKFAGSTKKMTTEELFRAEQLEVSRGNLISKGDGRELEKPALQLDLLDKEFKMAKEVILEAQEELRCDVADDEDKAIARLSLKKFKQRRAAIITEMCTVKECIAEVGTAGKKTTK